MKESDLLAHIQSRSAGLTASFGQVVVGPGDDCAVIRTPGGDHILLTVDQLILGRHADPNTPVDLIARKAIARSISDIAAMGGTPSWSLATACLPPDYPHADALFEAMHKWATHWACPLIGGDIATSPGPMVLTVTVGGLMNPSNAAPSAAGRPILRSGAQPGDVLLITGPLGGSLKSGHHLTFEPRLGAGRFAAQPGSGIHAMIDISDGLGRDAGRLARASGVVLEIDASWIPLNPAADSWASAARDGEDYELLMAASPAPIPVGAPALTPIGRARAPEPGEPPAAWVTDASGARHDVSDWGWDHT